MFLLGLRAIIGKVPNLVAIEASLCFALALATRFAALAALWLPFCLSLFSSGADHSRLVPRAESALYRHSLIFYSKET